MHSPTEAPNRDEDTHTSFTIPQNRLDCLSMRMGALNKQSIATAVGFDMEFYDEVLWRLYAGNHPELTGDCIYVRPRNVSKTLGRGALHTKESRGSLWGASSTG